MARASTSARAPSPLGAISDLATAMYRFDAHAQEIEPDSGDAVWFLRQYAVVDLVWAAAAVGVFPSAPVLISARELRWLWGPCGRCGSFTRLRAAPRGRGGSVGWGCGFCVDRLSEPLPAHLRTPPSLWEQRRSAIQDYALTVVVAGKRRRRAVRPAEEHPDATLAGLLPAWARLDVRAGALERWTPAAHQLVGEPGVVELVRAVATQGAFPTASVLLEAYELRRLWGPCPRCHRRVLLQRRTGRRYMDYVEWTCDTCLPLVRADHGSYVGDFGDGAPW